jgi:ABC-type multidrug transport system ATPase subunit
MPPTIRVQELSKNFRDIRAVDNLSFTVNPGEVYGFLGPNGAGKSTTIRMLLTLITPTSGQVELFGMDLARHRKEILRKVGAVIEKPDLYRYLSAYENMRIFSKMSGRRVSSRSIREQLAEVGLADRADDRVKTFSQGMKQRLGIAVALVHDPELIILDEPVNGLDPQGIADVRQFILRLSREKGKTVFISSHLLSEMELIADSMLIIDRGKKLVEGRVDEIFDPGSVVVEIESADAYSLSVYLSQFHYTVQNKASMVEVSLSREALPLLFQQVAVSNIPITAFQPRRSLEDYFLSLTKKDRN